jgi:superfamily II DNA or RNA helicase
MRSYRQDLVFSGAKLRHELWPHQQRALAAFDRSVAAGGSSSYLVVPPGGGKTLIGLEAARRLGRPTLVLCPNTAIQAQWMAQWQQVFGPPEDERATADRELPTPLTVLTYQAVCTIDSNSAHHQLPDGQLLDILHPNGRALLDRLTAQGPWTLVLDECHHLLEIWGRLLREIVARLKDPYLVGLTATPPHLMTADQKALHEEMFGAVDLEVSAPALVRDGHLAPYQELAWFTTPTPAEADYVHGEAIRFAELRTGLLDPGFAATSFLAWLRQRVVERRDTSRGDTGGGAQVSWDRFARDEPALADAALRLHSDGLLPLPEGARLREQHRQPPTAEDWVALIGDYCRHALLPSDDPRDQDAYEAIRRALPAIGYRLTRTGPRAAESPVDRVLARSQSKAQAVTEILRAESAELGDRLRALVLTDFAEAGGTVPAALTGVMDEGAGGARLALETLLADPDAAPLDPVLMTGQRVACGPDTAQRLVAWLAGAAPGLAATVLAADGTFEQAPAVEIEGGPGWEPRKYVPLITRFFAEGGSQCLIGTRALLGEGWDAPAVNVVIDLTAATTPTSVVQLRGRALRLDHGWPGKVADNWAVVCLTADHPKGAADYGRFVRKHDRYFALSYSTLSGSGDIISGVAHVDPDLSPFGPPDPGQLAELNAQMLVRAGQRSEARDRWNIGAPYADEPVATVTVTTRRALGLPRAYLPAAAERSAPVGRLLRAVRWCFRVAADADRAPSSGSLEDMAAAVADALHAEGLVSRGGDAVQLEALAGGYRARLGEVSAPESATFAAALEEVLAPLAQPRYLVPRLFLPRPDGRRAALALAARRLTGRGTPATVVYHAVPAVLGTNRKRAETFAQAWHTRVSPGDLLYAGSPEGAGVLAAQRGDDPFAVTTQLRTLWR